MTVTGQQLSLFPPTAAFSPDYLLCPGCGRNQARWNLFESGLYRKMLCAECLGSNRRPCFPRSVKPDAEAG